MPHSWAPPPPLQYSERNDFLSTFLYTQKGIPTSATSTAIKLLTGDSKLNYCDILADKMSIKNQELSNMGQYKSFLAYINSLILYNASEVIRVSSALLSKQLLLL